MTYSYDRYYIAFNIKEKISFRLNDDIFNKKVIKGLVEELHRRALAMSGQRNQRQTNIF